MNQNYYNLEKLWDEVYKLNTKHFPDNNLMPILGNGKNYKPKIMFVFINPTAKNISSDKNWKGPRFPFIGTKQIWRIFYRAGLLDDDLIKEINNNSSWSIGFTERVLQFLKEKSFYFTNIVKWTGKDSTLPDSRKINLFLPILEKEIELVQPEYIITFGLIPFEKLVKQKIKLSKYYENLIQKEEITYYNIKINEIKTKVIPCYFPIGRGNPKKAVEILKFIKKL